VSNYALIKDNLVVNVIVGNDLGQDFIDLLKAENSVDQVMLTTDSNAVVGATYDSSTNVFTFIPEQPFPSWTLVNNVWVAPKPEPTDLAKNQYVAWNETNQDWDILTAGPAGQALPAR
jgi:hypothetical protein